MAKSKYTPEFREMVATQQITSRSVLHNWIKMYNSNSELKDYDHKRAVYMAESIRKTYIAPAYI